MDMDDDAEDRRRLDRARVLVKTPWTPTIRHTVEVHIGDEHFKVFIVEECGGDTHACRRGRRSFCESSEEIDSDESYNGSFTPRSINSLGLEEEGRDATVPTTTGPQRMARSTTGDDENLRTNLLSGGQHDHHFTPGKRSSLRSMGSSCQDAPRGQTPPAAPQPTVTYFRDSLPKQGEKQCIRNATSAEKTKLSHKNGKSEMGECCAEVEAQRLVDNEPCEGEARYDVAENHIPLNARE